MFLDVESVRFVMSTKAVHDDEIITLNVGGTTFTTFKVTLTMHRNMSHVHIIKTLDLFKCLNIFIQ